MTLRSRLRLPPGPDVPFVVAGVGVWLGAASTGWAYSRGVSGWAAIATSVAVSGGTWSVARSRIGSSVAVSVTAVALVAGAAAGALQGQRIDATQAADIPPGVVDIVGVARTDARAERWGDAAVVDVIAVRTADGPQQPRGLRLIIRASALDVRPGDVVRAAGVIIRRAPTMLAGLPITGSVDAEQVEVIAESGALHIRAGNALRDRVLGELAVRGTQAEALTAGFLVGDISALGRVEQEELRRAGLTHFVAVSGGNVALFLAGVWILLIPVRLSPAARSVIGLAALVVFVVVTRWEPSVVRAAGMAALVLIGRILGYPVDPWRALGGGVAAVLLFSPQLAGSAGFHLSVAATTGLLLTSGMAGDRRPRWLWTGLTASAAAQLAVLPLLLWYFGTVPLLAPIANVAAAPLVALSTIAAGVGALVGVVPLVDLGVGVAGLVLVIARAAAAWPQLGPTASGLTLVMLGAAAWKPTRRVAVAIAVAIAVVFVVVPLVLPPSTPVGPSVTVLDVGEGDAMVIRGVDGTTVGVDTGRDPVVYQRALRRIGVTRLDLLVITHGDIDHAGGASGLLGRIAVGAVWLPQRRVQADEVVALIAAAQDAGIAVRSPPTGVALEFGAIRVEVLGPSRRYEAENDASIVLWVAGPRRSMLLAGDIEAVAQRDLPDLRPDVMVVPHHGSATTDPLWLARTLGSLAIISVGDNPFGHPARQTLAVLEASAVEVRMTQDDGDIVVLLD